MKTFRRWKFEWQLMAAGLLAVVGCGGSNGPVIYPVTGVVLRDGSPLADVNVEFVPDKGRPSAATTDKDGKFVLEYLQGSRGAIKGTHKIRVVERFRGASPEGPAPVDQFNPPPEPKSYELPNPAQVNATTNNFVIDVTAGTAMTSG